MFRLRKPKTTIALFSLLALTACDLYPDSGKWSGDVAVHDEYWNERYSCPLEIEIAHTSTTVELKNFDLYCGANSIHWSPDAFTRHGDTLWESGAQVGRIYGDGTVEIDLTDSRDLANYPLRADHIRVSWTPSGDHIHFTMREENAGRTRIFETYLQRSY